jgi:hypothetical protein
MTDPHPDTVSPAEDEPVTPFWLPPLGFALFVLGGIGWAVSPSLTSATPPALPPPTVVTAATVAPPPPPAPAPVAPPSAAPAPAQSAAPVHGARKVPPPAGMHPLKKPHA